MKFCPKCKMTVDAHSECPVCKNDLTNEQYTESKCERYAVNKYLIPYLIKHHAFPIICALIVIIRILLTLSHLNWYCLLALFCVGLSLASSLFKNAFYYLESWRFSEVYTDVRTAIAKYGAGIFGVIVAFFFW